MSVFGWADNYMSASIELLRWCDFPCDMPFAPDSVQALAKWFRNHGLGDHWGK